MKLLTMIASIILSGALAPDLGFSHARLRVVNADNTVPKLVPRNSSDANKGGATTDDMPCGRNSVNRGTNPVVLVVGETVEFEIEETINHNGRYEMNLSTAGQINFTNIVTITDDQAGAPSRANPNRYTGSFVVPDTPCTDCTLQMVQVMVNGANETYYKSCVDAIITSADAPPPAAPTGFAVSK
ncbi:SCE4755 family polysaccharide monooxygenase-like protein [Pseudobacteriovorax antillogorgiicola]|uniref:Chitin binding domain-containing protein n=1 Tax=Pseudobacteriovorax antillogorgiicola TaxID=1513793 RepID=A0A1Y6CF83_9BACT|nr:SCE4755 family polysaccharide monooxygenase-like protein [Pseudobacteriovorax antillogorgiicola]TCS47578.1 chitin binding protein [Pseudobacteriovorax antillogorgiicola]SMF60400.1 Chitin binding domain-containing protein [Pseudobacteriovorax antillogorgiicola]